MTPPRQLTLDWPHRPSFAREDFLVAPSNREALRAIDQWPAWASRMLLLIGPEGAGKSHLASLWATAANAPIVSGEMLGERSLELDSPSALLIEDADRVGKMEAKLFHIINAALNSAAWLMITARSTPEAWGLKTPDLLSRLRLAPIARLEAPDLELTETVLFKLFSDRQLTVEPSIVSYIALRIDRSLGTARNVVAALDREALARGRRVTRSMAAELVREMTPGEESP